MASQAAEAIHIAIRKDRPASLGCRVRVLPNSANKLWHTGLPALAAGLTLLFRAAPATATATEAEGERDSGRVTAY